ncbi:MAG: class I SAM-dependent methyltransferase [Alicyclobacillus sp.]|nr:class I SAM-dependent methyltransferase [Alicyclobacillus sp.]
MESVKLSRRLAAVASCVKQDAVLVDVGTDHARLPIHLLQTGRIRRAIATDIADGPCAAARRAVEAAGLTQRIEVRKGDGLRTVAPGEVDTIAIAGMGGGTAAAILAAGVSVLTRADRVVVQPMNVSEAVRRFLYMHAFHLVEEQVVPEDGRLYEVLAADAHLHAGSPDPSYAAFLDDPQALAMAFTFGPRLLASPSAAFLDHVRDTQRRWQRVANALAASRRLESDHRRMELERRVRWVSHWLEQVGVPG